jgi:hypothetical protein
MNSIDINEFYRILSDGIPEHRRVEFTGLATLFSDFKDLQSRVVSYRGRMVLESRTGRRNYEITTPEKDLHIVVARQGPIMNNGKYLSIPVCTTPSAILKLEDLDNIQY